MAYAKINSVTNANMAKVSNVAKAAIGKIGSIDAPSGFTNAYSLDFDGTNDYVILGDVTWGYGTLSLWFKTEEEDSIPLTIGSGQFVYLANKIYVAWPKHNGYLTYNYREYDDGAWHHLLCTFDAGVEEGEAKMYYDGSLVVTSNDMATATTTLALWFGQYGGGGIHFEGNLDEISWWDDTILDADAVLAVYNSGTAIDLSADSGDYDNSDDLTHWWRMGDDDTYPTIEDQVGSKDGTMTNMTSGDIEADVPSGGGGGD